MYVYGHVYVDVDVYIYICNTCKFAFAFAITQQSQLLHLSHPSRKVVAESVDHCNREDAYSAGTHLPDLGWASAVVVGRAS